MTSKRRKLKSAGVRRRPVERVARIIALYAPDAFSSSTPDKPCVAVWPDDWGESEQLGFRNLAQIIVEGLEPAPRPTEG